MRFIAAALAALAAFSYASACSCLPPPEFPDCSSSDYILYGKALSNNCVECTNCDFGDTVVKFELLCPLKQADGSELKAGDVVDVYSAIQSATCGYQMQPGTEYIIYTRPTPDPCAKDTTQSHKFRVNLCSGNIAKPTADQVAQLADTCGTSCGGKPEPPAPQTCAEKCTARCASSCESFCSSRPFWG